jgi:bifunctional polynucleotide phosphatase/kinase
MTDAVKVCFPTGQTPATAFPFPDPTARSSNGRDVTAVLPALTPSMPCGPGTWFQTDQCWCWSSPGAVPSSNVLAFDLDSTLVETKSGGAFAKNASDWQWWHPSVPDVIQAAAGKGFKIVLMSNQLGVSKGHTMVEDVQGRMQQVAVALGVANIQCFFATDNDFYRKPRPGMWAVFACLFNGAVPVDMAASKYIGDAAGRPKSKAHPKKDFSAGDLLFAINLGLAFSTPEEFFLGDPPCSTAGVEAHPLLNSGAASGAGGGTRTAASATTSTSTSTSTSTDTGPALTMVVLVGPPSAGKSTLCATRFAAYARVNQDLLKTKKKCLDVARGHLKAGRSVVIDATNKDRDTRRDWVSLAQETGAVPLAVEVVIPKSQW